MVGKRSSGEKIFSVCNVCIMIFMVIVCFYPFYYVLTCSLSDGEQLIGERGLMLLPKSFCLDAYRMVLSNPNIFTGYRNTLIVVVVGTVINLCMTSIGAFLLTRREFAIKGFLAYMMLFTMYFSGGMIPNYLMVSKTLHLQDSLWALILPGAINVYNLIVMRTNFAAIPPSLEESAKIDGANDFTVLVRIILPLSKPIIAVMVLFYGVAHWNAWFNAMLYIRSRGLYPLQLILREILLLNSTEAMMEDVGGDKYYIGESIKYATIIVATVPILCIYPLVQKYFVKGIMIGAVKG